MGCILRLAKSIYLLRAGVVLCRKQIVIIIRFQIREGLILGLFFMLVNTMNPRLESVVAHPILSLFFASYPGNPKDGKLLIDQDSLHLLLGESG